MVKVFIYSMNYLLNVTAPNYGQTVMVARLYIVKTLTILQFTSGTTVRLRFGVLLKYIAYICGPQRKNYNHLCDTRLCL